jgi:RHS repeat-associated protein
MRTGQIIVALFAALLVAPAAHATYWDSETGMTHNGLRDYSAQAGRFIEADPIGLDGATVGSANPYSVVGSNPLSNIDPTGLSDINYFPPGSPNYSDDKLFNPPGYFSVGGHGNSSIILNPEGQPLSPDDIAQSITGDPRYKAGEPIWLNSCSTGQGANSFAQQLSDILGVPVSAPDDAQWYHYQEARFIGIPYRQWVFETIGPDTKTNSGRRFTFCPGGDCANIRKVMP